MTLQVAATGIALGCLSNTLVKAAIAVFIARRILAAPVIAALGASFAAGAVGLVMMFWWQGAAAGLGS